VRIAPNPTAASGIKIVVGSMVLSLTGKPVSKVRKPLGKGHFQKYGTNPSALHLACVVRS
jgi:hypothetical protein